MRAKNTLFTGDNMKNGFLKSKHYAKLHARAKRILDRELSKPSDKWDEALISECEETMLYCAEMQKSLAGEKNEATRTTPSPRAKRAIIIALAVLTVLLVSSAVAQAAGFRIWSAIVHWDLDYLKVSYGGYYQDPPDAGSQNGGKPDHPVPAEEETEEYMLYSVDDIRAILGDEALYPKADLVLNKALLQRTEGVWVLNSEYSHPDGSVFMCVTKVATNDPEHAYIGSINNGNFSEVYEKSINGTDCVFGTSDDESVCNFTYGLAVYSISGDVDVQHMEDIVTGMLEGS